MGDEEDEAVPGGVRKLSDVRKQSFSPGHIQLSARQHEVSLGVDFPEN